MTLRPPSNLSAPLIYLDPEQPLFPRLRSGHPLFQRPSPQKQIPSKQIDLEAPLHKDVEFGHFKPVLEFPSQDQGQLANGSRKYRMLTLNLASAHLRIKSLSGVDLVRAFQGYRHFTGNGPNHESIEPASAIPYPLIVGPAVADLEIPLGNPIDTTKMVTLSWDEILPKNQRYGTFFVEAVGKSHPDYDGAGMPPTTQAIIQLTDINPFFPASGPATRSFNGHHLKSKFLANSKRMSMDFGNRGKTRRLCGFTRRSGSSASVR